MGIRIQSVEKGSPAYKAGILPDEIIMAINHEPLADEIDYQALSSEKKLSITISDPSGRTRDVFIRKKEWEPLGLCLDETVLMKPRHCRNHCLFCFVDQLPRGMRDTLYVKDDDWRLSLMMGNYVTLTNVDQQEFDRIIRRKVSPLYISVHATDPDVRVRLLRNPSAGNILVRLRALKDAGIQFHCQVVLCPGINNGLVLKQTITDLAGLFPAAQSLAIVPIGLTRHRAALAPMSPVSPEEAAAVITMVREYQAEFRKKFGTRFVFVSDEFYCISGLPFPAEDEYEDYPQIENGVGMLRQFESECIYAYNALTEQEKSSVCPCRILIPTGLSAYPFIRDLASRFSPSAVSVDVIPVTNRFFGESITVTGLIVASDLLDAVKNRAFDKMLISATMLKENSDRFLDDISLEEVRNTVGKPVVVVENNGEAFVRAIFGME